MLLFLFFTLCQAQDIFSPYVFNYYFYINTNPDLIAAGIRTEQQAEAHWENNGIAEGRQGCGSFHTKQYLDRYPDLQAAFGDNYTAALYHYLEDGINEGRLGYVEGGAYGRYTISRNITTGIFLSASPRMGGGIDSLVWNNNEFINCWDHGRELQLAITNGYGECFNPTECGSQDDAQKTTTTSQLLGIKCGGTNLQSTVNPAFWLAPGEKEPNPTPQCTTAINTVPTSNYTTSKSVTILNDNMIEYSFSLVNGANNDNIQIEGPTGYMGVYFSSFYTIDPSTGVVTAVDQSSGEVPLPLIFATSDGAYAMGAVGYAPPGWQLTYAKFFFPNLSGPTDNTAKWSVVYRSYGTFSQGLTWNLKSNLCVGDFNTVVKCMTGIATAASVGIPPSADKPSVTTHMKYV